MVGGGFQAYQAFAGGSISEPVWIGEAMSEGEMEVMFRTGRFNGKNRIVPEEVSVFGKVQKKIIFCRGALGKKG